MVHELGKHYAIATHAYGTEPRRHVDLFRIPVSCVPLVRLSQAARMTSDKIDQALGQNHYVSMTMRMMMMMMMIMMMMMMMMRISLFDQFGLQAPSLGCETSKGTTSGARLRGLPGVVPIIDQL